MDAITEDIAESPEAMVTGDRSLLLVEDDKLFLQRLARALEGRGFVVKIADVCLW